MLEDLTETIDAVEEIKNIVHVKNCSEFPFFLSLVNEDNSLHHDLYEFGSSIPQSLLSKLGSNIPSLAV